jgi:hypothetical protein
VAGPVGKQRCHQDEGWVVLGRRAGRSGLLVQESIKVPELFFLAAGLDDLRHGAVGCGAEGGSRGPRREVGAVREL